MSIPPSPSSPSLPYVTPTPTAAPAAALGPGGAVLSWPPSSSRLPLQATIIPIHLVGGSCSATAVAAAAAQLKNGDNGEQTNERTNERSAVRKTNSVGSHHLSIGNRGDKPEVVSKGERRNPKLKFLQPTN